MSKIAGYQGAVGVSTGLVAGARLWEIDYETEPFECTDYTSIDAYQCFAGKRHWSGAFYVINDTPIFTVGQTVSLSLYHTETERWTGRANIACIFPGVRVDGLATIGYEFYGQGGITPPSA